MVLKMEILQVEGGKEKGNVVLVDDSELEGKVILVTRS